MEFLPNQESLLIWIDHYGSFTLFVLLAVGIVALPVPEETLLVVTGVLLSQGDLKFIPTLIAAYTGSICGITGSYLIGRTVSDYLIHKYGRWVGLTLERYKRVHDWFEHYGKWSLVFGYFIPGVRHFTGIIAGAVDLHYRQFAFFAYGGALMWVTTFLSFGYFFGDYWLSALKSVVNAFETSVERTGLVLILLCILYFLYRMWKKKRKN